MNYHLVFDAAKPPSHLPVNVVGVMGYIGGPRAARAWTLADWLPFRGLRQFPCYVPDVGADPQAQGLEAVQLAVARGWSDSMKGSAQRAIVVDLETQVDAAWYSQIADVIGSRGFTPVAYGSLSTVLANAADDVIAADWNWQTPFVPAGQTLHGGQYAADVAFDGTSIDYSAFDDSLFLRGGVDARR